MTGKRIISRIACATAVVLALAGPSLAGKWTMVDNILTYVDDAAEGANRLDGGINDAANAGRKLDEADSGIRGVDDAGRVADEAGDAGDAGGLAAREPVVYDRFLATDLADDASDAAAEANKLIPNIVQQADEVGGAPKSIDTDGYTSAKSPEPLPNFTSSYADAPPDEVKPLFELNPSLVDAKQLPDLSVLALARSLPDVPNLQNLGRAAEDGASGLPTAVRAVGSDPVTDVAAARNGAGWSTRKKVILATGVTTGLLVTSGAAATAIVYSTYEPAKEAIDDVVDKTVDLGKQPVVLTVNNYTDDRVEIFEVLFNTRKSLGTIETSGDFASISAKMGDRIEITRNGEPFKTLVMEQDELIYVQ